MSQNKKNVILITIDCLRADHVSALGYGRDVTPNIDKLAEEGTLFTQAFSNGPCTNMSFPSIFTSAYALSYPSEQGEGADKKFHFPKLIGGTTLAEILESNGYDTAAFHSNPFLSSYYKYDRGFDSFSDLGENNLSEGGGILAKIKRRFELLQGKRPYGKNSDVTEKAISYLEQKTENKFFLWIHYMSPHWPYASRKFPLIDGGVIAKLSKTMDKETEKKIQILLYDEEVRKADREIGRLLKSLKEIGISTENTYFFITADHGQEFGEHGRWGHNNKPYDELIHVPLVISGPGIKKESENSGLVDLINIPPTILNLLDLEQPVDFQGEPLQMNGSQPRNDNAIISERQEEGELNISYRTKKWKYIFSLNREEKKELYNLSKDPKEENNISGNKEKIENKLREKIIQHLEKVERLKEERKKIESIRHALR